MKTKFFVIFIIVIVLLVGGIGYYMNKTSNAPSKLDAFAQALTARGLEFYGAFWCPHCQAQKAEFGSSKKYLPYVECSNPDNTPKQICLDNKVEAYPTWAFKDGIKITSSSEPTICPLVVKDVKQEGVCSNAASEYYRVWVFPEYGFSIKSPTDPIKTGNVWQFPSGVQTVGEVPTSFLAEQIQFTLPQ